MLAFFSGRYILKFQGPMSASSSDIVEISKIKLNFQKKVIPYAIVNFSSLYYSSERMELLSPKFTLDNFRVGAKNKNIDCGDKLKNSPKFFNLDLTSKQSTWNYIRCQKMFRVPFWFLKRPPYVDQNGNSYAYLLYELYKERGRQGLASWTKENLSYFHIKELAQLQLDLGPLGGLYGVLAGLDELSLSALMNRQGTILTRNFLLARIKYPSKLPILEYRFYLRSELEEFLEDTPYSISSNASNKRCLYMDGPICWRYNVKHLFNLVNFSTVISFAGILFIFILILWLLFSKIKQDKIEDLKRKLALQVLTHEFRTPVASLLLMMEKLNKNFNQYDNETQEDLLRMSSEIYRLQRLTEKSKHYLQSEHTDQLVNFNFEEVEYLEDLIEDVIMPIEETYGKKVKRVFSGLNNAAYVDIYWFQIILKNLVENAIVHGQGHIKVQVDNSDKEVFIAVQDEGTISKSLSELTKEFNKGNKSSGSGLGLSIISKVINDLNGEFILENDPTKFLVKLPRKQGN